MKAYFDNAGNLVIEAENQAEKAALRMWREINESDVLTVYELFCDEKFSLKIIDGNANCNAVSVTKSE
ncbi:hypothetical protein D4F06_18840 [Salmonella enterica subsp. enterica serovar Muenchen]|nr:hypothetical protein [Salmonella enterica subsp. enterica serovar Panama]EBW7186078.1 hypothetical protein [Salmonella enterica subsp. enterica serovar Muenchen]EEP1779638.1 hypothetical protein [Salmonella enterica]EBX4461004.1 hypothetical protein [Salmonella enterica subsp. enterica serovar Muenchen]EBY3556351.1 hypothetical protein [Salmonella enterica subsp. enterica serovar Muenchen]